MNKECKRCNSTNNKQVAQTFVNGTEHVRLECGDCGGFITYVTRPRSKEELMNFKFNYGKHNGETLQYVLKNDPDYITWLKGNEQKGVLKQALEQLVRPPDVNSEKCGEYTTQFMDSLKQRRKVPTKRAKTVKDTPMLFGPEY